MLESCLYLPVFRLRFPPKVTKKVLFSFEHHYEFVDLNIYDVSSVSIHFHH